MIHPKPRATQTLASPRIAALILFLSASVSGGFLIQADIADHQQVASHHPDQAGSHFFPGVPLGDQFQVKATEDELMHDDNQLFPGVPLGHYFQIGTPLGSQFQTGKAANAAGVSTEGIAVAWRSDG